MIPHGQADPRKRLNRRYQRPRRWCAKGTKGMMILSSDQRMRNGLYGVSQGLRFFAHMERSGLGVPGTQRQRWVPLAVNNFGLGLIVVGALWGDEGKGPPEAPYRADQRC